MTDLEPIVLEERISPALSKEVPRVDIVLRRKNTPYNFAFAYTHGLDGFFILFEVNGFYDNPVTRKRMNNPSSEGSTVHHHRGEFGVSPTFEEARARLYKRASYQAKSIAKKEGRAYEERRDSSNSNHNL